MKLVAQALVLLFIPAFVAVPHAAAQGGSIEFVARATPSGGLEEPVRGFPFYLLSKSFEEISKEVNAGFPKPDMNAFIDKLAVSPELKAWMKKNKWVTLSGEDFLHKLKVDDIMNVPEFYQAYMGRNAGDEAFDFPKPKYKAADRIKDPAKYEKLSTEYKDAVRHYIEQNPQSVDGIDINLADFDAGPKWNELQKKNAPEIHRRIIDLAESKYLVGKAQTDLQGQGFMRGIPPGNYWLSTLDVAANVGDARPRWDVPVMVRSGQTTYSALSNVNAILPSRSAP